MSFANSRTRVLITAKSNICVAFQSQLVAGSREGSQSGNKAQGSPSQGATWSISPFSPALGVCRSAVPRATATWQLPPCPFGAQQGNLAHTVCTEGIFTFLGGSTAESIPFLCVVCTWSRIRVTPCERRQRLCACSPGTLQSLSAVQGYKPCFWPSFKPS